MRKPKKAQGASLRGIGVDLVDVLRVKEFLKHHSQQACDKILTTREQRHWRRKGSSARTFSKLFAAKEAFFKALGKSWMGLKGFGSMEIQMLPRERFYARSVSSHDKNPAGSYGKFFTHRKRWVGACVIMWN